MSDAPPNTTGEEPWERIFHQSTTCLFACVEIYLLACLLLNEFNIQRRQRLRRQVPKRNPSHIETSAEKRKTSIMPARSPRPKRTARYTCISWFTILACCCAIFKTLSNELDLLGGKTSPLACTLVGIFVMCGYGGVVCFCMLVLWLRQDAVQNHPALKHLSRKKLRVNGSKVLLVAMLTVLLVLLVLNTVGLKLTPSPKGCRFDDMGSIAQSARASSVLVFTLFFQPVFAALLLYPLLKKLPIVGERQMPGVTRVRLLTKRTLVSLSMITLSDMGAIVASFLCEREPAIWVSTVYDLNCLVGVASIIFAYSDWRKVVKGVACCARDRQVMMGNLV